MLIPVYVCFWRIPAPRCFLVLLWAQGRAEGIVSRNFWCRRFGVNALWRRCIMQDMHHYHWPSFMHLRWTKLTYHLFLGNKIEGKCWCILRSYSSLYCAEMYPMVAIFAVFCRCIKMSKPKIKLKFNFQVLKGNNQIYITIKYTSIKL